jgi:hypothetical protein
VNRLQTLSSLLALQDVVVGARLLWSVRSFLRQPLSLDEALAIVGQRFERREADFLDLTRRGIYENPQSPYRQLLALAGCDYGDVERLVSQEGLEGALGYLFRQGVYLTVDELKGRQPAVRGSASISIAPWQLRTPGSSAHVVGQTSGSRGARTRVPIDLAAVRDHAVNRYLAHHARGSHTWALANWDLPGGAAIMAVLRQSLDGGPPRERWFVRVDPAATGLHPRYRWSIRMVRWTCALAGLRVPRPQYVPLGDPLPIADWMANILRQGRTPLLSTQVSAAVRLCQAALEAGIEIRGAQFWAGGEPLTAARLAAIHRAGAGIQLRYGSTEGGHVGISCLAPQAPDDLHFMHDRLALIQPGADGERGGLPPSALFISSLRPAARLHLVNVSLGDQAVVVQRQCSCPMERLGWPTHLHTVRSFEKLTAGGMNLLDSDLIRVLEEKLPGRFGGGPTDYQLLEEEDRDGLPGVSLLVRPSVGPLDPDLVTDAFFAAMGGGSGVERVMELQWRQAGWPRIERQAPLATPSGNILHLHKVPGPQSQVRSRST